MVIDGKVKAVNLRLLVDLHRRIAKKTETGGKSMILVVVELLERGFGEMGRERQQPKEKPYSRHTKQKWIERGRAVRDLLASFIVAFVLGHGGGCLVVWIVRGFGNILIYRA